MQTPLAYRKPATTWMITSAFLSLLLHGICWFLAKKIWGDDEALANSQRQMMLALGWMVCALAMWRISPPPSRLHAYVTAMVCALFLSVLGSVAALLKLVFVDQAPLNGKFLSSFAMLGGIVMLAHFMSALPSAALLQGIALTRKKAD